jgi:hypothetical protein
MIPERKITAAIIAGAITTIAVFVLSQVGVLLPPQVESAVGVLIGAAVACAAGYLTPSAKD